MTALSALDAFAVRLAETERDHGSIISNLFCSATLRSGKKRSVRLYVLRADGNGRPQIGTLVRELALAALDYCIPRKQVRQALEEYRRTSSARRLSALQSEASSLFSSLEKSGEGGELLLFLLTEAVLGYPQAVAKMSLKTASQMHFHGLDGIYISCGQPTSLRLHFGESKVHSSPTSSVKEAFASIAAALHDEGYLEAARRDVYILNTQVDLGDPALEAALQRFLDPSDNYYMSPTTCAVLLAGHNRKQYPAVTGTTAPSDMIRRSRALLRVAEDAAKEHKIDGFHIDLFLVPFPSVSDFRKLLRKELRLK